MNNHSMQNTEEEPIAVETIQTAPAAPFIAGCSHFTRENTRFRAPAFSPNDSPCNIRAAITMLFAASRGQHSSLYAHGNRTRQQSCNHYTAICNQRIKKWIELRRHEQPLDAEHRGGTDRGRNDPNRTRRTHEVPFIAGCSHFTRENTRLRAPAFSPNDTAHVASVQPLQCVLQHHVTNMHLSDQRIKKRIELRRHEQPLVAEHRGGTDHGRNDPNRTRRTHEVPFIAGCSHFTRENTRLRAPAFSPNDTPCNMAAESLPSAPAQVPVKLHDLHSNSILYFEYSLTLLLVMWCATHTHHHSLSIVSHF